MELQRLEYRLSVVNFNRSTNMGEFGTSLYIDGILAAPWKFEQYFLDNEHIAAVAIGPPSAAIDSYKKALDLDTLPKSSLLNATKATFPLLPSGSSSFRVLHITDLLPR